MMLRCGSWVLRCGILLLLVGCDIEDVYVYRDGGVAQGGETPMEQPPMEPMDPERRPLGSESQILAFLDGKTITMSADAVPTHPNGFDSNVNFGQASQCIHEVQMSVAAGAFRVETAMGTLMDAPELEDIGTCDRFTPDGNGLTFDTTASRIENVRDDGGCFDITLTYAGFGQEGRGSISNDRTEIRLELFFRDQAVGHRCADGDVGDPTITLNQEAFTGDAVQRYRVEE
ncbi:MAG: hypothetical protein RIT81_22995 [Deltaproteobacteria bacterium]